MEGLPFNRLIETIIYELKVKYQTGSSLHEIIEQIRNLPVEEQISNQESILKIEAAIKQHENDEFLTLQQYNSINRILEEVAYEATNMVFKRLCDSNIISDYSNSKKFDNDDIISDIVFGLFSNLSQNVMSSSLSGYISEYFETVELTLNDQPDIYQGITLDIKECFEKHGWKCKTETSLGGFQTSPNQLCLVSDFHKIIDKYF